MKKYNLVAGLTCIVAYHAGANAHTVDVKVVQEKLRANGAYQNL